MLAALIDLAADWAMVKQAGRGVPTIDLRVDYHRPAMPRRSHRARQGRALRLANSPPPRRRSSICDGKLLASGRGTYFTAPPQADSMTDGRIHQSRRSDPARSRSVEDRDHRSRRRAAPREFTFAQLDDMANGVARALVKRGLAARRPRRASSPLNRAEYLAAYYGIMRAGLVAVPVNFKFPRETIAIHHCAMPARSSCSATRRARRTARRTFRQRRRSATRSSTRFLDPGPFDAGRAGSRDEPAMFLYTSGSTGTPKGVVLSHQSHIWVVETRLARRTRAPPLSGRRAALSHERAGAGEARLRGARHHRAAAAIFRAAPTSKRSAAIAAPGSPRCRR